MFNQMRAVNSSELQTINGWLPTSLIKIFCLFFFITELFCNLKFYYCIFYFSLYYIFLFIKIKYNIKKFIIFIYSAQSIELDSFIYYIILNTKF